MSISGRASERSALKSAGVLFVTAAYAPVNLAGTARLIRFTRWLHKWGWRVQVLTMRPMAGTPIDSALLTQIPPDVRVLTRPAVYPLRALARLKKRLSKPASPPAAVSETAHGYGPGPLADLVHSAFLTPDSDVGWLLPASLAGIEFAGPNRPALVISSGPPHTAHLVALALSPILRAPWLADLRDPWSRNNWGTLAGGPIMGRLNAFEERLVVKRADRVVLNTDYLLDDFREAYPDHAETMLCIPNGYDGPIPQPAALALDPRRRPIRIVHVGTLYGARDPTPLLQALASLVTSGRVDPGDCELVFAGTVEERFDVLGSATSLGIRDCVTLIPHVPRREAEALVREADVLLLIQADAPLQIPSKLFDYITAGKPVLALADAGATAAFMAKARIGLVASPSERGQIEQALTRLLDPEYQARPDWDFLSIFSGERLARDLERQLLDLARQETA